jgi:23S rRNA pseudouridine955/2504/2580 synthase
MKSVNVGKNEAGQRLDRILTRLFPNAGKGFIFKMLRKKNIVLNGKKAEGNEKLNEGDEIKIFLSDETFAKMSGRENDSVYEGTRGNEKKSVDIKPDGGTVKEYARRIKDMTVYEDDDIIVLNKPEGVLSQKAKESDISLNEMLTAYMLDKGEIDEEQLKTFKPSMCNRLDRNTTGLICGGKSLKGLQFLSEIFRNRTVDKYYLCVVKGRVEDFKRIEGYLVKDEKTNTVRIQKEQNRDAVHIVTEYRPLEIEDDRTILEVKLITGKSHQIRAHLASIGHPIAGDAKYGDPVFNRWAKKHYGADSQMLVAYRLVFPKDCKGFSRLNGMEIKLLHKTDLSGIFYIKKQDAEHRFVTGEKPKAFSR